MSTVMVFEAFGASLPRDPRRAGMVAQQGYCSQAKAGAQTRIYQVVWGAGERFGEVLTSLQYLTAPHPPTFNDAVGILWLHIFSSQFPVPRHCDPAIEVAVAIEVILKALAIVMSVAFTVLGPGFQMSGRCAVLGTPAGSWEL